MMIIFMGKGNEDNIYEHLQLDARLRRSARSHDLAVEVPRSNLVCQRFFVPPSARIWNQKRWKNVPVLITILVQPISTALICF